MSTRHFMNERTFLDLPLENGLRFFLKTSALGSTKDELEEFLSDNDNMKKLDFTKKVLFSHELQSNNQVEGYYDDIELINNIIKRKIRNINDIEKKQRILNLYNGYKFILKYKLVNEKSLKKLYDILSKDLLIEYDLNHMGKYYREDIVYILSDRLDMDDEDTGVDYQNINELMSKYFAFYNHNHSKDLTDEYIISQILHFYFVYIHPYFDVNGRTSRTMAMWHLIKNEAYPFIIFNRGISFHRNEYYRAISDAKTSHDLTGFLLYMMKEVKLELEKEYLVQNIAKNSKYNLDSEDYQTLLYFMSINGNRTALDFASIYNRLIDKKKILEIYEKMIVPLIDKEILLVTRYCKKCINKDMPNVELEINKKLVDCDRNKIKRLII